MECSGYPILRSSSLPAFVLNQGPFPPPALPGFIGTTSPSATPRSPVPPLARHRLAAGPQPLRRASRVALSSPFMQAVDTTPAQSVGACFAHFPTNDCLPRAQVGSACALPFSRPAQRLLTLRPACSPNPLKDPLHRRLQPIRYLHGCSDCYRPERKLPGGICTRRKTAPWHGALERMVRPRLNWHDLPFFVLQQHG